jgi:hypothetical protein
LALIPVQILNKSIGWVSLWGMVYTYLPGTDHIRWKPTIYCPVRVVSFAAQILNKSIGWVSLWGMVYTYLPGVLVCYWQLLARRPSVRLPGWLKAWMDARKQLGLLSLFTSEWDSGLWRTCLVDMFVGWQVIVFDCTVACLLHRPWGGDSAAAASCRI